MISDIWAEFLNIVKEEIGSRVVDTWFKAVSLRKWDAEKQEVHLEAPNEFVRAWIQSNYTFFIRTHLGRLLNVSMPKVLFTNIQQESSKSVSEKTGAHELTVVPAVLSSSEPSSSKTGLVRKTKRHFSGHVNRRYSFETFVVGSSNSLAYAASHAVTKKPGMIYNPLFIYGGSGLGKTHLLHAIGNEIKKNDKQATILYQTADRFVNEFISAIRFDKVYKFQAKYKAIDVLLIDDIQFISNKDQTQEAFFHIFNSLYDERKQIVFSSDVIPNRIGGLAERLRSRLACGLVTDIHLPPLETKIAILKKKAGEMDEEIDDPVAHFIASIVDSNIRELEGALIRVMAFASLTNQDVSLELAQKVLTPIHKGHEQQIIEFDNILRSVRKHYPYDKKQLTSKSRNKDLSFVRQISMFLMKKLTDKSLREIGLFFGGRDHSTVMHAVNKIEKYIQNNTEFSTQLKRIENEIRR